MGLICGKQKTRRVYSSEHVASPEAAPPAHSTATRNSADGPKLTFASIYQSPAKKKQANERSPKHVIASGNKVSPVHVVAEEQKSSPKRGATPSSALFRATARSVQASVRVQRMMSLRRGSLPNLPDSLCVPVTRPRSSSVGALMTSPSVTANTSVLGASRMVIGAKNKLMKKQVSECDDRRTEEPMTKREATMETGVFFLEDDSVNYYQRLEELGSGSFGVVCKCFSTRHNMHFAMKIISKKRLIRKNRMLRGPGRPAPGPRGGRSDPLETLHREIAILKKMDHPNIVNLVEVIDDNQVDNVYMVFELMPGGTVIEVPTATPLSEHQARVYFRDLVLGVEFLHFSKIIHRDIKPANLLLDGKGRLKIADFGVSDMFEGDDDFLHKFTGTPAFQAPEVLEHDATGRFSGKAVDVWAMGVTLFCFVYGVVPFDADAVNGLHDAIQHDPVVFPTLPLVNPQLQILIQRMTEKKSQERVTIAAIKEDSWVTNVGTEPMTDTNEHCTAIEVSDEDVRNSIKFISNISSVLLAKQILKGKSFAANSRLRVPTV